MSGIILPEKISQILLTNKMDVFNNNVSTYLPEILNPEMYGSKALEDWITYYTKHPVKVKLGWPFEEVNTPTLYVAAADAVYDDTTIGFAERHNLSTDTIATEDMFMYLKSAKIIAMTDNYNISLTLAAIAQYFIHQENMWFENYGMYFPKINYQEIDLLTQFRPQKFFYRTFIVTFACLDIIIISKDDTIRGIDINVEVY